MSAERKEVRESRLTTRGRRPAAVTLLVLALLLAACSGGGDAGGEGTAGGTAPAASGYTVVDPAALQDLMGSEHVYLVNVHVPYEGELPGTDAFIPFDEIASRLGELPFEDQKVVIYCRSGNMSTQAAQAMVAAGAPQFYTLDGGWYAWQDAGLPFEVKQNAA